MRGDQAQPVAGGDQRSVIAMFIATPPGSRVIRPGTSDPSRIEVGDRPMMSHRTEPMHRMSGVMAVFIAEAAGARKGRGCALRQARLYARHFTGVTGADAGRNPVRSTGCPGSSPG